jgi:hypothetical protein
MLNTTTALAACLVTETRRGRAIDAMRPDRHAARAVTTALFFTCDPEQGLPQGLQQTVAGEPAFFRAASNLKSAGPSTSAPPPSDGPAAILLSANVPRLASAAPNRAVLRSIRRALAAHLPPAGTGNDRAPILGGAR